MILSRQRGSEYPTKNPSFPHLKPLSSTPKRVTVKLTYTELFWCGTEWFLVCWTEGFSELNWGGVLNWGVCGGWKGVALLCGTDVLNWGGCGTEGDPVEVKIAREIILFFHLLKTCYWMQNIIWYVTVTVTETSCFRKKLLLTLSRPTCQSWHFKVFFSFHGSAWATMSKRWKNIPFI